MYHRVKWLRTRFIRRFDHILESTHVLKTISTSTNSWVENKLRTDLYDDDVEKYEAWFDEMNAVHAETRSATGNALCIQTSKRLPWFLASKSPSHVLRPILNWILKRYPGMDPPKCSKCLVARATHDHIGLCSNIMDAECPDIQSRFRPEKFLSSCPGPENNHVEVLYQVARNIALAVSISIPQFNFEILSNN